MGKLSGPTGLGATSRNQNEILDPAGGDVKQRQDPTSILTPNENQRPRIHRPRRVFPFRDGAGITTPRRNHADLESGSGLASERNPFAVGGPVGFRAIANPSSGKSNGLAAGRSDGVEGGPAAQP